MTDIVELTRQFQESTARCIGDLFGVEADAKELPETTPSLATEKRFLVAVQYTGMVHGEYVLSMDESTAAGVIGWEEPLDSDNRELFEESITDAVSECLNMVVGESIPQLQEAFGRVTLTAPRVIFGSVRYPRFSTAKGTVSLALGEVECHLCLDTMRLDLATSYDEALESLTAVNDQLTKANRLLQEQQAQLVHAEKMASVGVLASGVAHEINTPLFFVDANLKAMDDYVSIIESTFGLYDRLCEPLNQDGNNNDLGIWTQQLKDVAEVSKEQDLSFVMEDTKHLVGETREGILRIKEVVQGLKDFSQADGEDVLEVDVNRVVTNACDLLSHQMGEKIEMETRLGSIPSVVCGATEIGQVVAAVLMNAFQSLDGDGDGRVCVSTESDDEFVSIAIQDNGCGIETEHLDRLFDPFFTTKPVGSGTGLGLSIAYGIMKKYQGTIDVESVVGTGTTISIRIPLVASDQTAELGGESPLAETSDPGSEPDSEQKVAIEA